MHFYSISEIIEKGKKLALSNYEQKENQECVDLVNLILYLNDEFNFVNFNGLVRSMFTYEEIKEYNPFKEIKIEKLQKLNLLKGSQSEFAKKVNVLVEIFNKYCTFEIEYVDVGFHKEIYEETGSFIVKGKIPGVLSKVINERIKKIEEYDKKIAQDYIKYVKLNYEKEKIELDRDVKRFYEELTK